MAEVKIATGSQEPDGCHGCSEWGSKGWVVVNGNAQRCPVCLGSGQRQFVQYPPVVVPTPIWVEPYYVQRPCQWCGEYNCQKTHIICNGSNGSWTFGTGINSSGVSWILGTDGPRC